MRRAISLVMIMGVCVSGFGCGTATVWKAEVQSPDGLWTASVETIQNGGFGTADIETVVYLMPRNSLFKSPKEVLQFSCTGPVPRPYTLDQANAGGTIDLTMKWVTPSHLDVTYDGNPRLDFQLAQYGGVEISARDLNTVGAPPLTEEQVGVYRALLGRFSSLHFGDLANLTMPFDFKGFPEGRPCLNGIKLEQSLESLRTIHAIGREITQGTELRLIDPSEPRSSPHYVELSEIAFDTKHEFALVKYLSVCGPHCVSGASLVMAKSNGEWAVSSRHPCAIFLGN